MAYSMTGWGTCQAEGYTVNIKGLNSKYKEVALHLPQEFFSAEPFIYRFLNEAISRGRVDLYINIDKGSQKKNIIVDEKLFLKSYRAIKRAMDKAGIKDRVPVETIFERVEGVLSAEPGKKGRDYSWDKVKNSMKKVFADFMLMKKKEGDRLVIDISSRLDAIAAETDKIKKEHEKFKAAYITRAKEKIETVLGKAGKDKIMNSDIVEILDKFDITEETVRINSHVIQAKKILGDMSCGRKLDFLAQELYREANTIASKIPDASVAHFVIAIKENTDRVREQAQNLE